MTPALQAPPSERRTNGRIPPPPPHHGGGDDDDRDHGRRFDNLRLAVLVFIGAEAMFFGALISALLVLRLGMAAWPPPLEPRLPIAVTGANTLVLLASSGFHGLHVVAALIWLLVTTLLVARHRFQPGHSAGVQACAMYWHFVVGVWPVLYLTVYLL